MKLINNSTIFTGLISLYKILGHFSPENKDKILEEEQVLDKWYRKQLCERDYREQQDYLNSYRLQKISLRNKRSLSNLEEIEVVNINDENLIESLNNDSDYEEILPLPIDISSLDQAFDQNLDYFNDSEDDSYYSSLPSSTSRRLYRRSKSKSGNYQSNTNNNNNHGYGDLIYEEKIIVINGIKCIAYPNCVHSTECEQLMQCLSENNQTDLLDWLRNTSNRASICKDKSKASLKEIKRSYKKLPRKINKYPYQKFDKNKYGLN